MITQDLTAEMTKPANLDCRPTSFNAATNYFTVYKDNLNLISQ